DRRALHGIVQQAPMLAAVLAAVQALVRPGVHDLAPLRVRNQRSNHGVGMKAHPDPNPTPRIPIVGALHDRLSDGPDQNRPLRHDVTLLARTRDLATSLPPVSSQDCLPSKESMWGAFPSTPSFRRR